VISKIETGQIEVKLSNLPDLQGGGRRSRGRRRSRNGRNGHIELSVGGGGSFTWAFTFLAALAGGIVLTYMHLSTPGWFCLGLAALSLIAMWVRR
jgi:hypothetical protein